MVLTEQQDTLLFSLLLLRFEGEIVPLEEVLTASE